MVVRSKLYLSVSLLSLAAASPALAQSQAPAPQVEEVVVTAQRKSENLQDVPLAVSAFSPKMIEAVQLRDTTDLARFTPSVTGGLNTGTGSALMFYIRGLGSTEQIASFDVPVATYVDEIYLARQSANAVSLFDVAGVEVMRGPQGTLFGRNTTGGAVAITTRKPSSEFGYFVEGSYGTFNHTMIRGSVDVPISDTVLTKFSAFKVDDDGFGRSLATNEKINGEDAKGVRAAVTLLPTENIRWDISLDYIDQAKTTLGYSPVDPKYKSRTGLRVGKCDENVIDNFLKNSTGSCARVQTGGLTSNLEYDLSWAKVNFITGYRSTDQSFAIDFLNAAAPRGGYTMVDKVTNHQFTQEVKLVGETDRVNWVAGAFYMDETNKTSQIDYFGRLLTDWVMRNNTTSAAIYAQGDVKVTDALTLTVGGRYTHEKKDLAYFDAAKGSYPAGVIVALPAPNLRPTSANVAAIGVPLEQSISRFTPRVALAYKIDDDKMVFASVTNGFKSGGWNTRVTNVNAVTIFGPEKAWSYELGARTDWLDNRLRVNATIYHEEVQDLQLLSGTGGTTFVTRNSGDLRATGLELEASASVNSNFDIFATASAAKRKYVNVPDRFGGAAGNIPCSNTPEPINCTTERDTPVRFPDVQATLGATYKVDVPSLDGAVNFNGSLSYSQSYWSSSYNDGGLLTAIPFGGTTPVTVPFAKTPASTMVNLGVAFRTNDGHWTAALECANCTSEYYVTSSLFGVGYYNDPRRVTLRLKYNY